MLIAGVHVFADQVAAGGTVDGIVIVEPAGIIERKAFVMASCQGDILAARSLCRQDQILCVEIFCGEAIL